MRTIVLSTGSSLSYLGKTGILGVLALLGGACWNQARPSATDAATTLPGGPAPHARTIGNDVGGIAGRGGYLLPPGYLSTRGSQIVNADGNPVRIASIGWNGGDSLAFVPDGLMSVSYTVIIDSIKQDGFNTIRLPYSDVMLTAPNIPPRFINYNMNTNSALLSKTPLQVLDAIIQYAGSIGLKIIIDHHNNDGGPEGGGGQQTNGLWFDFGKGSHGTDGYKGGGKVGTITDARFQANWVLLASRYAGNPVVIGFDLDNEPLAYAGLTTWGDESATDIHAMYERVGNAVHAVNPGLLIIAEGPQNYKGAFVGNTPMPFGDLTAVSATPVVLKQPNKVVYSVHIYPYEVNGVRPDSGPAAVARYNATFGFLYSGTYRAPVWIGEMGASGNTPDGNRWAATLLAYMNGDNWTAGGPRFTENQQPVSGSWWVAGYKGPPQIPDGTQSAWGSGNYRLEQQSLTDQLLYAPAQPVRPPRL